MPCRPSLVTLVYDAPPRSPAPTRLCETPYADHRGEPWASGCHTRGAAHRHHLRRLERATKAPDGSIRWTLTLTRARHAMQPCSHALLPILRAIWLTAHLTAAILCAIWLSPSRCRMHTYAGPPILLRWPAPFSSTAPLLTKIHAHGSKQTAGVFGHCYWRRPLMRRRQMTSPQHLPMPIA